MRVMLKLTLDCTPDAAWAAIRSPRVFRAVSAPFTTFTSLDPQGFPESWPTGEHRVLARAFGLLPLGEQVILISTSSAGDVRLVHDDGHGVSGLLTSVKDWHHTMAVSPLPNGKTLYRDQLRFSGSPLLWPMYWAFWQWRAASMRRMAPTWR
jgi:hypothetical protein